MKGIFKGVMLLSVQSSSQALNVMYGLLQLYVNSWGQYTISLSLERPVSAIDGLDQGLDRFDDFDLDTQLNRIIRRYPASLCFERKKGRGVTRIERKSKQWEKVIIACCS